MNKMQFYLYLIPFILIGAIGCYLYVSSIVEILHANAKAQPIVYKVAAGLRMFMGILFSAGALVYIAYGN